jgi:hypothetical protein
MRKEPFFFMQVMCTDFFFAVEFSVHRTLSKIVIKIMPSTYNNTFQYYHRYSGYIVSFQVSIFKIREPRVMIQYNFYSRISYKLATLYCTRWVTPNGKIWGREIWVSLDRRRTTLTMTVCWVWSWHYIQNFYMWMRKD